MQFPLDPGVKQPWNQSQYVTISNFNVSSQKKWKMMEVGRIFYSNWTWTLKKCRIRKIEFLQNKEKGRLRIYLGAIFNIKFWYFGQKKTKMTGAGMVLASAVKWAEMAANDENGRNLKKFFAPVWPYYMAIWYLKCNFLSDLP